MARYDLTDFEWRVIKPLLPNKPRGVPPVDDRRVLNGIFWVAEAASVGGLVHIWIRLFLIPSAMSISPRDGMFMISHFGFYPPLQATEKLAEVACRSRALPSCCDTSPLR